MILRTLLALVLFAFASSLCLRAASEDEELAASVHELRTSHGDWDVTTDFLAPDGSVSGSAQGTYHFEWVVEDRVLTGRSEIPSLGTSSGILFYVREKEREIEMVSVGSDGKLWIMTGPLGGSVRTSREVESATGGTLQLRFTRSEVTDDGFESHMEYTNDGGKTWLPGNHQVFRRPI